MTVYDKLKEHLPKDVDESVLNEKIEGKLWDMTPVEFASMGPEYLHVAINVIGELKGG